LLRKFKLKLEHMSGEKKKHKRDKTTGGSQLSVVTEGPTQIPQHKANRAKTGGEKGGGVMVEYDKKENTVI